MFNRVFVSLFFLALVLVFAGQVNAIACASGMTPVDNACYPEGSSYCSGIVCSPDQSCVNSMCQKKGSFSCGTTTCSPDQSCVNGACYTKGSSYCAGVVCGPKETCVDGACQPAGSKVCAPGLVCNPDQYCYQGLSCKSCNCKPDQVCIESNNGRSVDRLCLPKGSYLCGDSFTICRPGQACYGYPSFDYFDYDGRMDYLCDLPGRVVCSSKSTRTSGTCAPEDKCVDGECIAAGVECGGQRCSPGQVCVNDACHPEGSFACNQQVCSPGEKCMNGACTLSEETPCGFRPCTGGETCINGVCFPAGSTLCANIGGGGSTTGVTCASNSQCASVYCEHVGSGGSSGSGGSVDCTTPEGRAKAPDIMCPVDYKAVATQIPKGVASQVVEGSACTDVWGGNCIQAGLACSFTGGGFGYCYDPGTVGGFNHVCKSGGSCFNGLKCVGNWCSFDPAANCGANRDPCCSDSRFQCLKGLNCVNHNCVDPRCSGGVCGRMNELCYNDNTCDSGYYCIRGRCSDTTCDSENSKCCFSNNVGFCFNNLKCTNGICVQCSKETESCSDDRDCCVNLKCSNGKCASLFPTPTSTPTATPTPTVTVTPPPLPSPAYPTPFCLHLGEGCGIGNPCCKGEGLECKAGKCVEATVVGCSASNPCQSGTCVNGVCVSPSGVACSSQTCSSVCVSPSGVACSSDSTCPTGTSCVAGVCAPSGGPAYGAQSATCNRDLGVCTCPPEYLPVGGAGVVTSGNFVVCGPDSTCNAKTGKCVPKGQKTMRVDECDAKTGACTKKTMSVESCTETGSCIKKLLSTEECDATTGNCVLKRGITGAEDCDVFGNCGGSAPAGCAAAGVDVYETGCEGAKGKKLDCIREWRSDCRYPVLGPFAGPEPTCPSGYPIERQEGCYLLGMRIGDMVVCQKEEYVSTECSENPSCPQGYASAGVSACGLSKDEMRYCCTLGSASPEPSAYEVGLKSVKVDVGAFKLKDKFETSANLFSLAGFKRGALITYSRNGSDYYAAVMEFDSIADALASVDKYADKIGLSASQGRIGQRAVKGGTSAAASFAGLPPDTSGFLWNSGSVLVFVQASGSISLDVSGVFVSGSSELVEAYLTAFPA